MKKTIYLILLLVIQFNAYSQTQLTDQQIEAIDELFEEWKSEDHPGVAIGIIKNQEIVFTKGYGMSDLEHRIPFQETSVADIGSVAKQLTCFAIVLLEQEGKLSIDDDIRTHLDYVPDFGQTITIRNLMQHTSGLREIYTSLYIAGRQDGDLLRQSDVIQLVKHQKELNFPPGDDFLYCNTSYGLLAEIIKKVSGQDYERFLRKNIFEPLGMNNTFVMDKQGELFPNCSESYSKSRSKFTKKYDNCTMVGQGGIYSTVLDMLKWLNNYEHPIVGGAAAVKKMHSSKGVLNSGDTLDYAFGLYQKQYKGIERIYHSGASAGFRSNLNWLPEHQIGFILMSNFSDFSSDKTAKKVIDILLKDKMNQDYNSSYQVNNGEKEVTPPVVVKEAPDLNSYAGTYYSEELKTTYELYVKNNALRASHFKIGDFLLALKTSEKDFFSSRIGEIRFERAKDNEISAFRVSMDRVVGIKFTKVRF